MFKKLANKLILLARSVGVTVDVGGGTVGGPTSVGNTHVNSVHSIKVEVVLQRVDLVLQQLYLASAFHQLKFKRN